MNAPKYKPNAIRPIRMAATIFIVRFCMQTAPCPEPGQGMPIYLISGAVAKVW